MEGSVPDLCDAVVVKHDALFGNTAFAARSMRRGDVVLREEPMLVVRSIHRIEEGLAIAEQSSQRDDAAMVVGAFVAVARQTGLPPQFFDAIVSIVLEPRATTAVVEALEADLYAPHEAAGNRTEREAASLLLGPTWVDRCFPPWCASVSYWRSLQCAAGGEGVARLLALVHACRINLHEAKGDGFVFQKASKLAHSCNANTYWYMEAHAPPRVVHIALRPIQAGERLTFSYLGAGLNLLLPTLHRREMLSDLGFTCMCERCVATDTQGFDASRMLPCPQCAVSSPCGAAVHTTLASCLTAGSWKCKVCNAAYWKEDAMARILFDERSLHASVMELFFRSAKAHRAPSAMDAEAKVMWASIGHSSTGRQVAALDHALLQRWAACRACVAVLTTAHYLFPCAFSGMMTALLQAIKACRTGTAAEPTEIQTLLVRLRQPPPPSEGTNSIASMDQWPEELIRWYMGASQWFGEHAPGSAQEARAMLLFGEALDALVGDAVVVALLLADERHTLSKLRIALEQQGSHPRQQFNALVSYDDFQPMLPPVQIMSSPLRIVEVQYGTPDGCCVVMVLSWNRRLRIGGVDGCDIRLRESPLRRACMEISFKMDEGAAAEDISGAQLLLELGSAASNAVLVNGLRVVATNQRRPSVRLRVGDVVAFAGSRRSFAVEWCGPLPMPPSVAPTPCEAWMATGCERNGSPLRSPVAMRVAARRHAEGCSPVPRHVSPFRQHRPLMARHVDGNRPSLLPDPVLDLDAILLEEDIVSHSIPHPPCPASSMDMQYDPLSLCAPPPSIEVPLRAATSPPRCADPPTHASCPAQCRIAPYYLCCTDGGGRALLPVATHHMHERIGTKEQLITARGAAQVMRGIAVLSDSTVEGTGVGGAPVGSHPSMPCRFIELLVHRYDKRENRFEPYDAHVAMLRLFATRILTAASAILQDEPPIVSVSSPAWCCGDLHGSFADALCLMEQGLPFGQVAYQTHPFVFLGDYVDRGEHSVEVALLLLAWKIAQPRRLVLLRGNHEDPAVNGDDEQYGDTSFHRKCNAVFGPSLGDAFWAQCNDAFAMLPVAAVMDRSIFLCHGGVPNFGHINRSMQRRVAPPTSPAAEESLDVACLFSWLVSSGAAQGATPSPTRPHPTPEEAYGTEDATTVRFFKHIGSLMPQVEDDAVQCAMRQLARELVWNDPCPNSPHSSPNRNWAADAVGGDVADTHILVGAPYATFTPAAGAGTDALAVPPLDADGFRCNVGRGDTDGIIHEYSNKAVEHFLASHGWSLLVRAHQHKAYGIEVIHHAQVITLFSSCNYANANAAGACFVREGTVHLVSWQRAPMSPPRGRGSAEARGLTEDANVPVQPPVLWSCGLLPSSAHLTTRSLGVAPVLSPPMPAVSPAAIVGMPALVSEPEEAPPALAPTPSAPLLEAVLRLPARCEKPKPTAASPPPRVPPPLGTPTAPTHRRRKTICG